MGYIYKIRNLNTGKLYIGQTIRDLDTRWNEHKKINSNCRYLKRKSLKGFVFKYT